MKGKAGDYLIYDEAAAPIMRIRSKRLGTMLRSTTG